LPHRHCEPTGPARRGRPDDELRETIQATCPLLDCFVASLLAMTLAGIVPAGARAQGYSGYPYSIMTPERGAAIHRHELRHRRETTRETEAATAPAAQPQRPSLLGHEKFIAKLHRHGLYAARGSSGVVLPTPLPKTQLIPPEGGGALILPPMQQEQGPTRTPAPRKSFPTCRMVGKHFRTAPRGARFKLGFTACREVYATNIWAPACSDTVARPRESGDPIHNRITFLDSRLHGNERSAGSTDLITDQRKLALIFSSAAEPGQSSFSSNALSGVSTVFKCPCRSEASAST
jgi:hypothetical protein